MAVAEVAGFVIGDGGLTTAGSGDAAAGLDEKLVDVLDLVSSRPHLALLVFGADVDGASPGLDGYP